MNKGQIAKKYSKSLVGMFSIREIEGILSGLKTFLSLIESDRKLRLLFASRIFSEDERDRALHTVLDAVKASPHTEKFLRLIMIRGHLSALREIIKASTAAYNEKLKKTSATVISSVVLEKQYVDRLREAIKAQTERDVDLEAQVDPSLLGGFVVRVNSTIYDSSLKGQLNRLRADLTK